jgi:hypothetical protein
MKKCRGKSNLNIVQDYLDGVRPFTQLSMNVPEKAKHRKNGEKWTDSGGIEWLKKDGKTIKLTKTQGDIIREAVGEGLNCKNCGLQYKWGTRLDLKFMRRTRLCSDCLIDFETKLRVLGIYSDYEQYHLASHELGFLKDAREKIKETIDYFNRTGGDVTKIAESEYDPNIIWKNTNKDKMLNDATADLEKVEALIVTGSLVTEGLKNQYLNAVKKYDLGSYV